jgi:hypothetical protein
MRFYKAKIVLVTSFLVVGSLGAPAKSYAALVGCPDTWNIPPSQGQITLIDKDSVPADFSFTNFYSIDDIQIYLNMGLSYLVIKNYSDPLSPAFKQKILDGGRDISVTGQWKISNDGKTWRGLSSLQGTLLPEGSSRTYTGAPRSGTVRNINKVDFAYPATTATRFGMTPNSRFALETKVDVAGCKQSISYESISSIPEYAASSKSLDSIIEAYYLARPTIQKINFIAQKSCNETLNSFVSHIRDVSSKSQTWTIKNTKRGTLDLGWSLTAPENTTCGESQGLPGIDLSVTPSRGDGCMTLTTPYGSTYTYKTLKYPCSVSVDYAGSEVAKFEISKPKTSINIQPTTKKITCTNGKLTQQITGAKPVCPKGYKKIN